MRHEIDAASSPSKPQTPICNAQAFTAMLLTQRLDTLARDTLVRIVEICWELVRPVLGREYVLLVLGGGALLAWAGVSHRHPFLTMTCGI